MLYSQPVSSRASSSLSNSHDDTSAEEVSEAESYEEIGDSSMRDIQKRTPSQRSKRKRESDSESCKEIVNTFKRGLRRRTLPQGPKRKRESDASDPDEDFAPSSNNSSDRNVYLKELFLTLMVFFLHLIFYNYYLDLTKID